MALRCDSVEDAPDDDRYEGAPMITATEDWRELAHRAADGLHVTLLWSRASGRIRLSVADLYFDEGFAVDVAGHDAMRAFRHPFAFASARPAPPAVAAPPPGRDRLHGYTLPVVRELPRPGVEPEGDASTW
jgi:hypothetical protein